MEAKKYAENAIELEPGNAYGYAILAQMYINKNNQTHREIAVQYAYKALELDNSFSYALEVFNEKK